MTAPFPEHFLEQPVSLDIAEDGRMLAADRGGRRLCVGKPGGKPATFTPAFRSRHARFLGPHLLVLTDDGDVRTLTTGGMVGEMQVRPGAVNVAATPGGGVLVTYGRRGGHDVTLERLGTHPLEYRDPAVLDATALAVESGGYWIAGTGSEDPAARAVRLRPTADGLDVLETVALPAPPRAAAIGPDGALYVLLEPGESLVRIFDGASGPAQRLPAPATDLARGPRRLWSCGGRGLFDLTHLVPPPEGPGPEFDLPACSP